MSAALAAWDFDPALTVPRNIADWPVGHSNAGAGDPGRKYT
jgi:hypothetical protein